MHTDGSSYIEKSWPRFVTFGLLTRAKKTFQGFIMLQCVKPLRVFMLAANCPRFAGNEKSRRRNSLLSVKFS